jgi:hypothetical protein
MPIEDAVGSIRSLRSARLLVGASKPGEADHVSSQNRREFPGLSHGNPSPHARIARLFVGIDRLFRLADDVGQRAT